MDFFWQQTQWLVFDLLNLTIFCQILWQKIFNKYRDTEGFVLASFPVAWRQSRRQLLHNRAHREGPRTPTAEPPPPPPPGVWELPPRWCLCGCFPPPSPQGAPSLGVTEGLSEQVLDVRIPWCMTRNTGVPLPWYKTTPTLPGQPIEWPGLVNQAPSKTSRYLISVWIPSFSQSRLIKRVNIGGLLFGSAPFY